MRHTDPTFSTGLKSQPAGYSFETRDYEQFQLIYVTDGTLLFSGEEGDYALKPGMMILLRHGSRFRLSCRKEGYKGVYVAVMNETPPEFRGSAVSAVAQPSVRMLAEMLREEATASPGRSDHVLRGLGEAILWQAIRFIEKSGTRSNFVEYGPYWAERARQALLAAIYTGQTARSILSAFRLSYRQISRYFQEAFGVSPKQYQVRARIEEAQRLLLSTKMPITTMAYEMHFSSSQHFATQFMELTGMTPSAWREKHYGHPKDSTT